MGLPEDSADVTAVWLELYKSFIEAVDGVDNGVNQYESDKPPRWGVGDVLSPQTEAAASRQPHLRARVAACGGTRGKACQPLHVLVVATSTWCLA
jgi:hypothetical protein